MTAALEDREGNIWVGTTRGIDRFRNPKLRHVSSLEGLSSDFITTVHPAAQSGSMWVGTATGGVNLVAEGKVTRF